jgi:hypothetical protein
MASVVSGTFADRSAAQEAVERLQAAGIPASDISLIGRDTQTRGETAVASTDFPRGSTTREEVAPASAEDTSADPFPAVKGAEIGSISGLLIGLEARPETGR